MSPTITPVASVEIAVDAAPWPFAEQHRAAIEAHFAKLKAANPALFKGELYMLADWAIEAGTFRGRAIAADYAAFLYWRDTGSPDRSVVNAFGSGAIHGRDGALILGVMAAHTANAGKIYPPSGSLEAADVRGGGIDVAGNIAREIAEETGLAVARPGEGGWLVIEEGPRIALMARIELALPGAEIAVAVRAHIAGEARPELAGVHLVRGRGDIVPDRMPPYTQAYVRHAFAA